jgi:hypothetical protein
MAALRSSQPQVLLVLPAACSALLLASCGFCQTTVPQQCSDFEDAAVTPLTSQSAQIGFQDAGTIDWLFCRKDLAS